MVCPYIDVMIDIGLMPIETIEVHLLALNMYNGLAHWHRCSSALIYIRILVDISFVT